MSSPDNDWAAFGAAVDEVVDQVLAADDGMAHLYLCCPARPDQPHTDDCPSREMTKGDSSHPALVRDAGELVPDPGCSSCGACMQHDGCADVDNPLDLKRGDCAECGACADCIARCAEDRKEL